MPYADYNNIGIYYDTTRRADPYLSKRIHELLAVKEHGDVLDIGCGSGNYTQAMAKGDLGMTGIDPSTTMLEHARKRPSTINWMQGYAEALPFQDRSFDGAMAILTTHHWNDLAAGCKEAHRILRPGSKLVLFTSTPEQMKGYWLCHYFPLTMERSCSAMPSRAFTEKCLRDAGFKEITSEPYSIRPDLQDQFLYAAKDDPRLYLDATFRNGSSTFSSLADPTELEQGLERLKADIEDHTWNTVRENYVHDQGDYLFLAAQRTIA